MPKVARHTAAATAIAALLLAGVVAPATASEGHGDRLHSPRSQQAIQEAAWDAEAVQMITEFAEREGLDADTMAADMRGQVEFDMAAEQLRASVPEAIVESRWLGGEGQILVTEGNGQEVQTALDALDVPASAVEIDSPSAIDLETIQTDILDTYYRDHGAIGTSEVDVEAGVIYVTLDREVEAPLAAARSTAESSSELQGLRVEVTVDPDAMPESAAARGGRSYSPPGCTAGFIVRQGTPLRYGVLSAGHCDSWPSTYDGQAVTGSSAMSNRDLRVLWLSGTPTKQFQVQSGVYFTASGQTEPSVGSSVCKYGAVTGQSCSTVTVSGYCSTGVWAGRTICGLFKTRNQYVRGGDSGGPWFVGSVAYGITSGYGSANGTSYDLFTGTSGNNLGPLGVVVYR
ncbi:S1 family peptidase [Agrococcus sp. Marseille-Q4369]|uniref:S1 family peptidase n=1 Tax=Agrococcus sp. Marseille-Q4369 TaxID=2810513 RepID=UPI001B8B87E0|nr:S1 family peptidase [Agrococcus sp. Marseille-Q4369]QUW18639.1 trypsin-like serine protease [Agrococcus sp. Marseille-Q4369]